MLLSYNNLKRKPYKQVVMDGFKRITKYSVWINLSVTLLMRTVLSMTPDQLLKILQQDRRITVTAENIDAVRQITIDDQFLLRRRISKPPVRRLRTFGIVNRLVELPKSVEPEVGDFLYMVCVEPPKKE